MILISFSPTALFSAEQQDQDYPQTKKPKKIHQCLICDHIFYCSSNLTRHIRVHTGERPYKCSTCPMTFVNSTNRKKHERRCPFKPFCCTICSLILHTPEERRNHQAVCENKVMCQEAALAESDDFSSPPPPTCLICNQIMYTPESHQHQES